MGVADAKGGYKQIGLLTDPGDTDCTRSKNFFLGVLTSNEDGIEVGFICRFSKLILEFSGPKFTRLAIVQIKNDKNICL